MDCEINGVIGHRRSYTNHRGDDVCACGVQTGRRAQGRRDGNTITAEDLKPLNAQAQRVWDVLKFGQWYTLADIAGKTGDPEGSVSARIRDLRKPKFGGHVVDKRQTPTGRQWEYRLTPNQ
jgi:hypothetical protein